ncbi:DUF3040 family protein [Haloactinospora alba]|uniref:DUF3040 family protein n=1 Tax=Haloactinospora alba TaxID=405555 RepID=A0A543NIF4_9ACTN|nr:DUF3040 domain-containing protein [Haloactinospora alba]TQN31534.1 DUF3040 family protein [Haloactinospora alba]
MALREYERRILAEIEQHLSEEEPQLASRFAEFGTRETTPDREAKPDGWKPWLVAGAIAVFVIGVLVVLLVATPSAPQPEQTTPGTVPESVVPENGAE